MAKKKKPSAHYYFQKYHLIFAGGALVFVGALLFSNLQSKGLLDVADTSQVSNFKASTSPVETKSSVPTPTTDTKQVVKDGIYTNYTYGFRFKYPQDVFKHFIHISRKVDKSSIIQEAEFTDVEGGGYPKKYSLILYVNNQDVSGSEASFVDYYNKPANTAIYSEDEIHARKLVWNNIKIKNVSKNDFIGYIKYGYYTQYMSDYEPSVVHEAVLKMKDNLFITLNISSPVDVKADIYKDERLKILQDVIDSFRTL